jgi:hypothetical protein
MPGSSSPGEPRDNATGASEPEQESDSDQMPRLRSDSDTSPSDQASDSDWEQSPRSRRICEEEQCGMFLRAFQSLAPGAEIRASYDFNYWQDPRLPPGNEAYDDSWVHPLFELSLYPVGHSHNGVDQVHRTFGCPRSGEDDHIESKTN